MPTNPIAITDRLHIGHGQPLCIIAGPCLAESHAICAEIAETVKAACQTAGFSYIFKASFDKANRSSIASDRGPGLAAGLKIIADVGRQFDLPTTTDIHETSQAAIAAQTVDLLQIPAFLCRQTDLLVAAARTGKAVNVKKGQFMSPAEMSNVLAKLSEANAANVMLTERGTFFGYNRLINDFVGLGDMMDLGAPVCFDVTHSTQQPGGQGAMSGGRPDRAPLLAKAAVAAGVDALFIECHPDPAAGRSDAATMLPLAVLKELLPQLARIRAATIS